MTGKVRIWQDNFAFWPDIIRWPAVISRPEPRVKLIQLWTTDPWFSQLWIHTEDTALLQQCVLIGPDVYKTVYNIFYFLQIVSKLMMICVTFTNCIQVKRLFVLSSCEMQGKLSRQTISGSIEKKYGLPIWKFLAGELNFSLFLFIELSKWRCLIRVIVKINVFTMCIFIIFKLVYFTAVNLDLHFKYKIFSQLNDLVCMSCAKQMKYIYIWNITCYFFTWQFKFVRLVQVQKQGQCH
jgi:hypothetical protein